MASSLPLRHILKMICRAQAQNDLSSSGSNLWPVHFVCAMFSKQSVELREKSKRVRDIFGIFGVEDPEDINSSDAQV